MHVIHQYMQTGWGTRTRNTNHDDPNTTARMHMRPHQTRPICTHHDYETTRTEQNVEQHISLTQASQHANIPPPGRYALRA